MTGLHRHPSLLRRIFNHIAGNVGRLNNLDRPLPHERMTRPCTVPTAHDATECNGYHLDDSDV